MSPGTHVSFLEIAGNLALSYLADKAKKEHDY